MFHKSNTTDATSGTGTTYPFGAPEYTLVFVRYSEYKKDIVFQQDDLSQGEIIVSNYQ
jgi:hypothetical protein